MCGWVSASTVVAVDVVGATDAIGFLCATWRRVDANPAGGGRHIQHDRHRSKKLMFRRVTWPSARHRFRLKQTPRQFRGPASDGVWVSVLVCACAIEPRFVPKCPGTQNTIGRKRRTHLTGMRADRYDLCARTQKGVNLWRASRVHHMVRA